MRSSANDPPRASDPLHSSSLDDSSIQVSIQRKRNRRKVRVKREEGVEGEQITRATRIEPVFIPKKNSDAIQSLDRELLTKTTAAKARVRPKRVTVQFTSHEPSAHVIKLQGMARRVVAKKPRSPSARTMNAWVAPCEAPPSLERMASEALDLYIDSIDAQDLYAQFTPFDPEVAYRERRGTWERVRAPFIRWELRWHPVETSAQEAEFYQEDPSLEIMVSPSLFTESSDEQEAPRIETPPAPPGFEEQFTTGETPSSFLRRLRQLRHAWGDRVEGAVDGLREREEEVVADVEQAWGVPVLVPKVHVIRVLAGFAALLCLVTLPAGAVSLSHSFSSSVNQSIATGREAVGEARGALSAGVAGGPEALGRASARFASANDELLRANGLALALAQALPKSRALVTAGHRLLDAGQKSTRAAQLLAEGLTHAWTMPVQHTDERLLALQTYVNAATPLVEEALQGVKEIEPSVLPEDLRAQVSVLNASLIQGESTLLDVKSLVQLGISTLGHDRPRTYLFIFQNQSELRPTGGFMGSLAEVTFDRGEIKSIVVPGGGPYDLRSQLKARVLPPEPLRLVSSRWEFQDANWFADFPTAAQKIDWFWSKSGQPTLDGIITINAHVLQMLLKSTGPITLPEYGKTLDAENVMLELQKSVELEYDKTENKPKKIIGDLLPLLLEKMRGTDEQGMLTYARVFGEALQTKDIQLWFRNADEQSVAQEMGWDGSFPAVVGDTLALNEANIGGQKTDAVIDERTTHDIDIQADGSVVDTVTLERQHTGSKGELFQGANNVAYIRLYAPSGSTLIDADGFQPPPLTAYKATDTDALPDEDVARVELEIGQEANGVQVTEEYGRTVFGGWVQLRPGGSSKTTFRYKLPMNVFDLAERLKDQSSTNPKESTSSSNTRAAYLLSSISQSGKADRGLTVRVHAPASWKLSWTNQSWDAGSLNGYTLTLPAWNHDRIVALLFDVPHAKTP